jgi:hypothetical protein
LTGSTLDPELQTPYGIADLVSIALRNIGKILGITAVVAILFGLASQKPVDSSYAVRARVESLVGGRTVASGIPAPSAPDDIAVFSSDELLESVAKKLDIDRSRLLTPIVIQVPNTNIYDVGVRSPKSRPQAEVTKLVDAYADAWVENRNKAAKPLIDANLALFQETLDEAIDERNTLLRSLADAETSPVTEAIQAEILQTNATANQARENLALAREAQKLKVARVVQKADLATTAIVIASANTPGAVSSALDPTVPAASGLRSVAKVAIVGGILGSMLAAALTIGIPILRGEINGRRQAAAALPDVPVLGELPPSSSLDQLAPQPQDFVDGIRRLRTVIVASAERENALTENKGMSILFVEPSGTSHVALLVAHLAKIWSTAGERVHLVDADRQGTVTSLFGATPEVSLLDALLSDEAPKPMRLATNLVLIGNTPHVDADARSDFLGGRKLAGLITAGSERGAITLVVGDGVLNSADATSLARLVDVVVMVVPAQTTKKNQLRSAALALEPIAGVSGLVLTSVNSPKLPFAKQRMASTT